MTEKPTYDELEKKIQELEKAESESKKTKEVLKLFKESVDNSSDAIGMSTPEGRHYYQNKVFDRMFGNVGETPPKTLYVNQEIGEEVFSAIMSGKQWTGEVKMYSKNKTIRDIFLRAYANKDELGNITALVGIHSDITEHKQVEDALRVSEKEYRETLNDLIVGVVVHSSDTSILLCNPEASNILGLTQDQMSGKKAIDPAWKFVYEDLSIMKIEDYPVSKVFSIKKPLQDYVVGIIRPDRDYITWVIVNAIPIFSNNNELKKIVINFVDITERKHAQVGREKLLKELQKALENVKTLNGLIPICSYCKKIRDDTGYWNQLEAHIQKHSYAKFSHGMCPECSDELYGNEDWYIKMMKKKEK